MAASTKQAHDQVVAARRRLGRELDELGPAARSAIDIPAKIRRRPFQTAGLIGGAGFLAVGGPKRMLRAIERRVRPARADRLRGILPRDVERIVERAGAGAEDVRQRLEQDFYDWLSKRRPRQAPASARQSFWRTYDAIIGPLGALGAKSLAGRIFAADRTRTPASAATVDEEPGDIGVGDIATGHVGEKLSTGGSPPSSG